MHTIMLLCLLSSRVKLPTLYDEVAAHPNASEDVRRAAEAKLLRYRLELLESLAGSDNLDLRKKVWMALDESIKGVVLLGIPDEVAWGLHFQWEDSKSIGKHIATSLYSSPFDVMVSKRGITLHYSSNTPLCSLPPSSVKFLLDTSHIATLARQWKRRRSRAKSPSTLH